MAGLQIDLVQVALIVNICAIIVSLVTAGMIAWANAGSRNLALASGTLAAAIILFVIQLPFELQRSTIRDRISTEFTIDRAAPQIRQWAYSITSLMSSSRLNAEAGASTWLASTHPSAFGANRDKLTMDFALLSFLSFMTAMEFDWQLDSVTYKGKSSGVITMLRRVSKDEEFTTLTKTDLATLLTRAGNVFGGAPLSVTSGTLCLPPRSKLDLSEKALTIRTPICQISFTANLADALSHMKPGTGGQTPQLPSGEPQYETRWIGFEVETTYFALRAQHRESSKYRDWCSRLVKDAREWFEG